MALNRPNQFEQERASCGSVCHWGAIMKALLKASIFILSIAAHMWTEEIRVSVQIQPKQRDAFEQMFRQFEQETGIKVQSVVANDLDYKLKLPEWLIQGKDTPDVVYWCASQRLYEYVRREAVYPITELWEANSFDKQFSHIKRGVTYQGKVYAVPFAYYHWGLFYRKSVIEKFGGLPQDWESFVAICARMKDAGIVPIGIGTKENWPAAAWFDYLNLRINGLGFHLKLLAGEVSFNDQRAQVVFREWKRLIDPGFYNEDSRMYTWEGVLPHFYRENIGFLLMGNFVASKWTTLESIRNDIGFMPFPTINEHVPSYEEAPTDVFLIPNKAQNIQGAERFLRFIARADVQSSLCEGLGYIPANNSATIGEDLITRAGHQLLVKANDLSQFFDRDTLPAFDKIATPLLAEFLNTGDVLRVTENLEQARLKVFHRTSEKLDHE
jgi:multiple sugar transport system substrate-binding protein